MAFLWIKLVAFRQCQRLYLGPKVDYNARIQHIHGFSLHCAAGIANKRRAELNYVYVF